MEKGIMLRLRDLEVFLEQNGLRGILDPGNPVKIASLKPLAEQGLSAFTFSLSLAMPEIKAILKVYRDRKKAMKELLLFEVLKEYRIPMPLVYGFDIEGKIFGRPFLILEEIGGEDFRKDPKLFLERLAWMLCKVHSVDPRRIENIGLRIKTFRDEMKELKAISLLFSLFSFSTFPMRIVLKGARTFKGMRSSSRFTLVHGDCSLGNIIYRGDKVYLIDWEDAFIGDPAYDVGYLYHSIRLSFPSDPKLSDYFMDVYSDLSGISNGFEVYKIVVALKLGILLRFMKRPNILLNLLVGSEKLQMLEEGREFIEMAEGYYLSYSYEWIN